MRYIIIGAGAVGGTIGGCLAQAGNDVVLVARGAHLDALRSEGLVLATPLGTRTLDVPAVGGPAELSLTRQDVLIVAVKSQDTEQVLREWAWQPVSGDALAVIGWSGDIQGLDLENDDRFAFAIPDAGGTLWSDNLMVPSTSSRLTDAEKLFDYYYDPAVAAQVAAWVNYITPVQDAKEAMADVDPSLVDNELIFPSAETLTKVAVFRTLDPDEDESYGSRFLEAIGA